MKKRSKNCRLLAQLFICLCAVLWGGCLNLTAQEIKITAAGNPSKFTGLNAEDIEPSAVEPIDRDGKYLLVADDKNDDDKNSLAIVETAGGRVVRRLQIPGRTKNPKWEGLAKDDQGNFYVIGSHFDTDADGLKARSFLYRFSLKMNADPAKIEIETESRPPIELNVRKSLKALGLYQERAPAPGDLRAKIEGLAWRANGNQKELIIGLREPSDFVRVYSAALPAASAGNAELSLKPLFRFYAGRIQAAFFKLSSIEYLPQLKGFLILTSTEEPGTNAFFGNTLWFVSDQTLAAVPAQPAGRFKSVNPQLVWVFGMEMKAEGLCLLPGSTAAKIHFAIVYDNDKKDTGKLGMMQTVELSR